MQTLDTCPYDPPWLVSDGLQQTLDSDRSTPTVVGQGMPVMPLIGARDDGAPHFPMPHIM
jgi:hypothetical protein